MSTLRKEDSNETSDPVFLNSGEVSQEVVKEKKEPTMSDLFTFMGSMNDRLTAQLTDVKTDTANLMVRMEVMENRMAVQEARVSPSRTPPRSRAPSQESVKELKTEVRVVEVSGRSSLIEDFGSLEDSTSEDSAGVNLPVKTPVPGGPQFFARSLEADTRAGKAKEFVPKQMFKVQQPISGVAKPVEDEDPGPLAKEQVFTRFLKDHPAEPKLKADTGWLQMGSDTPDLEDFKRPPPNLQMLDGRTVNQYVITESPADIKE